MKYHLTEILRRLQLTGDNRRVLIALHHYGITAQEAWQHDKAPQSAV